MPVGDVLVRDTRSNVEHDDTALALDVVTIAETTELLLAGGIPDVEADGAEVGGEGKRVHFNTEGGCTAMAKRSVILNLVTVPGRDDAAYRCTSSRIHPSSGATR